SLDGTRWVACRPGFFLPVRLFRRLFLGELQAAYAGRRLGFFGELAALARPAAFAHRLSALRHQEWVVYAKPPFGGPHQVLAYLGRYTHRVAIANRRLVTIEGGQVAFRWRDWRHHGKAKVMMLAADEFIRRFLLHSLPDGLHRIRHYGFLANRERTHKLALCRRLLAAEAPGSGRDPDPPPQPTTPTAFETCPDCGGAMGQVRYRAAPCILPSLARYLMTRTTGFVPLLNSAPHRDAVASRAFSRPQSHHPAPRHRLNRQAGHNPCRRPLPIR